ncbi:MAG: hypothetical protein A2046_05555, partial [Bacteroidetes bacterium GWA2_30_7]
MKQLILISLILLSQLTFSQTDTIINNPKAKSKTSKVAPFEGFIGLGMGLDYGGFGINFLVYPQKNIGVFGGVGYAIAGLGWNAGIKARFAPEKYFINPYLIAMYGYNAAVYFKNMPDRNQIFYGYSVGFGIDFHLSKYGHSYLQLGLLFPIRTAE